ncbi:MAG: hypothetical protein K2J95_10140 [Lachnospiraceae bacterium]|nr:hypothetical protein [Lachnospiraceae bacterium]
MAQLLLIREQIKSIYSRYEAFIVPILKFLLALITMIFINHNIGYAERLSGAAVTILVALFCSFLPLNFIVMISAVFILLHLYALSLEAVLVVGALVFLMFLLYFRFAPKDTVLLILTPILFSMRIPYVIPLSAGLVGTPASMVSVGCGVVIYYALSYVSLNASVLVASDTETVFEKIRTLIDAIIQNKEMLMVIVAFSATILTVYLIRRLSVDHSWTIAIITGTLMNILIILIGDLKYNTYISIVGLIFGSIISIFVSIVLKFFVFNVDYGRTERVQFEDDEYYYYVKAVPKNTVAIPNKKVKKIKGHSGDAQRSDSVSHTSRRSRSESDVPEYRMRRSATKGSQSEEQPITSRSKGNKNGTKRIILPDEEVRDIDLSEQSRAIRRTDGSGMTGIERAAAAKARQEREERRRRDQ